MTGEAHVYGSTGIPIEKLRGIEDYNNWKFSMRMLLMHEDLLECIESAKGSSEVRKNHRALAKICLSVHSNAFSHVRNAKTAYEAWTNLQKAYEDKGLCRRLGLLRSLFGTRLLDNASMEAYIAKITEIAQQLDDIGSPLDDDFVAVIMLSGLTPNYDPLIMALENSSDKLESENVKTKLLQEFHRRDEKTEPVSALVTKKQIKCFRCKRPGHTKKNCPKNAGFSTPMSKNKEKEKALLTALSVNLRRNVWYVDSGATNHMCNDRSVMLELTQTKELSVNIANGDQLCTAGLGKVKIRLKNGYKIISNVYLVPQLSTNLLSVSELTRKGYKVNFDTKTCKIMDGPETIATAKYVNGVYQLNTLDIGLNCSIVSDVGMQPLCMVSDSSNLSKLDCDVSEHSNMETQEVWHRRLGHLNSRSMNIMKNGMVFGINYDNSKFKSCIACIKGKLAKLPFSKQSSSRCKEILGLIHTDLCGPMPNKSLSGARYFLTFIDDFSRKTFVYFLKSKEEVFDKFKLFKNLVEKETDRKIKMIRSDNGGEYINNQFQEFLQQQGIRHQTTVPHCSPQNGVAERANRTIMDKARCMLQDAGLGSEFWAEAVNTSVYLKNCSPTKAVMGMTPQEKWTNTKVNVGHLRIFGCVAYALTANHKKLDSKAKKYIFVGYCNDSKGYRLIDPEKPQHCIKAYHVVFLEDCFWNNKLSHDDTNPIIHEISHTEPLVSSDQHTQDNSVQCMSENFHSDDRNRNRDTIFSINDTSSSFDTDNSSDETYIPGSSAEGSTSDFSDAVDVNLHAKLADGQFGDHGDPETVKEALGSNDAEEWRQAMQDEYKSFITNKCWSLVDLPRGQKAVKCKWVFKKKKSLDGKLLKYKARLVAKGYTQRYGIDYNETFSPVVRYSTIRLLLALAAEYDLEINHLDVKTAFLNGELEEHVLMEQPEGFIEEGQEHKVYKLHKAIYGLKQAAKSWYEKINGILLTKLNFNKLPSEPCVYYKGQGREIVIIALYVDDIILFSSQKSLERDIVKEKLMSEFEMKDLGPAHQILGMRVCRNKEYITLDQSNYIQMVLSKFNMSDCKPSLTPMETGLKLQKSEVKDANLDYRNLIGCLMYISVCSRPDISHSVSVLSQFNECFNETHWKAAKRVLRYLKGTHNYCLKFQKGGLNIDGFTDADWAANEIDRRSYTGYVFKLGNSVISWESRKQRTVALSSTEAEYMAISDACKEAMFLRTFLNECLKINCKINLYNDNQSALKLCSNSMFHARTKHIDIRHHFIRDVVIKKFINVCYMPTGDMIADLLTKPLTREKHVKFVLSLLTI